MIRVVRNKLTGKFINIDPILIESDEYDDAIQATIFNEEVDELSDADVIEYIASSYPTPVDLEIVPIKIKCDIL